MHPAIDFATRPGRMTTPGTCAPLFDELPTDLAGLARVGHGVLIHEHIAGAYDVTLTDEQRASVHLRPVESILRAVVADDDRPLTVARTPERRLPGNCRHYSVLLVSMLRAQGVPARARCGFGGYFRSGTLEDHWVCEYRDERRGAWVLADGQIDDVQQRLFAPGFDVLDVPRDQFLVAGEAWRRCRAGEDDPQRYGLSIIHEAGMWWIAANLVRDVASLTGLEMLPWDVWGAMPKPTTVIDDEAAALFDRLAELTATPDEAFDELCALAGGDDRVRVPAAVFNAARQRMEDV